MITAEVKLKLETAIETVLFMASKGTPLMELAKRIYADERELISQVQESWILDRLVWMLSRRRQAIPPVDSQEAESQLMLPGFERLPRRLTIGGRRTALHLATLAQLKEYRNILLRQIIDAMKATKDPLEDPRIVALDKLIALVSRYAAKKSNRSITVADVMIAEKAKQNHQP